MPYSDALKSLRQGDYGEDKPDKKGASSRVINLTDEEAKELQGYQEKYGPGEEIVIEATGKVEGDHFHVMSVRYAPEKGSMDANAGAEEVMAKMRGPVTPMQVQPSPS